MCEGWALPHYNVFGFGACMCVTWVVSLNPGKPKGCTWAPYGAPYIFMCLDLLHSCGWVVCVYVSLRGTMCLVAQLLVLG